MSSLLRLAVYILLLIVAARLARKLIKKAIWRLRNRLIVAYLFIAVVPISLILVLVALAGWAVIGQMAIYIVSSELDRRTFELRGPAEMLAHTLGQNREDVLRRVAPYLAARFPGTRFHIRDAGEFRYPPDAEISAPPKGWGNLSGIVEKDGQLYGWAHTVRETAEVTLMAPLTRDFLAGLAPDVGDVFFLNVPELPGGRRAPKPTPDRRPPAASRFDVAFDWVSPITVSLWSSPGQTRYALLMVRSRPSAVLRTVFGQKVEWAQSVLLVAVIVLFLFLIVELISLIIGISITRTVTRAVHNLYEGTQRVKEGDFSHRIEVRGDDQLAVLGASFNRMTENLQRLILVEKEKERLQSELEIAREVQHQLFPKSIPSLKTLRIAGLCAPARMVSGDYYDFVSLCEGQAAIAIGDVAGKGISAALLMAAIQSIMRTQLSASLALSATAGDGNPRQSVSTARLVSVLNRQLYANTSPEKYATFCIALYDDESSILTYTNAGHLAPILVRNTAIERLESTGTIVGAFPASQYQERQMELRSGDVLVAYTDGIIEPENEYGEMFGEERLAELIRKHSRQDSGEIISRVMEAVRQWTGAPELQDDMTMLVLHRV